jgi:hypothetical protein
MIASQNGVCTSQQICHRIVLLSTTALLVKVIKITKICHFVILSFVCDAAVANLPLCSSTKLAWW